MRRILILAGGAVLIVLMLAQLGLPAIAARRLRDQLSRSGRVLHVQVDAFPAIKLLWHDADKVVVRLAQYQSDPGQLGSELDQASDAGTIDASVAELDTGLLVLRDARLKKRGDELTGSARVTESDLRAALPIMQDVRPVASSDGTLTLRGTATLLGVRATINASVRAVDGRLVVQPDVPFGGLATLTLFDNPHIAVQSVGATGTSDGFVVTARARLH